MPVPEVWTRPTADPGPAPASLRISPPAPTGVHLPRVSEGEATADAAGVAQISFGRPGGGWAWLLEAATIVTATAGVISIYRGEVNDRSLIDRVADDLAVGEFFPPRVVGGTRELIVRATGLTAGDLMTANVQYREVPVG